MGDLWGPEARERARRENAQRKIGLRECRMCGEWMPLEHFVRERNSLQGYRHDCRECWVQRELWRRRHKQ